MHKLCHVSSLGGWSQLKSEKISPGATGGLDLSWSSQQKCQAVKPVNLVNLVKLSGLGYQMAQREPQVPPSAAQISP